MVKAIAAQPTRKLVAEVALDRLTPIQARAELDWATVDEYVLTIPEDGVDNPPFPPGEGIVDVAEG